MMKSEFGFDDIVDLTRSDNFKNAILTIGIVEVSTTFYGFKVLDFEFNLI